MEILILIIPTIVIAGVLLIQYFIDKRDDSFYKKKKQEEESTYSSQGHIPFDFKDNGYTQIVHFTNTNGDDYYQTLPSGTTEVIIPSVWINNDSDSSSGSFDFGGGDFGGGGSGESY